MDQEKKLRILKIAKDNFEQFGYKKTTVDEIATNAGISKRTLYEMFSSKENILSELVMNEAFLYRSIMDNKLKNIEDPLEKLKIFTKSSVVYFRGNPFLEKILNDESGLYAPFLKDEISYIEKSIEGFFANILCEGTQRGIFREMDEKATANCIFILYRSFTYAKALKPNKAWIQFVLNAIVKENAS